VDAQRALGCGVYRPAAKPAPAQPAAAPGPAAVLRPLALAA
jgi:hypothetical protein